MGYLERHLDSFSGSVCKTFEQDTQDAIEDIACCAQTTLPPLRSRMASSFKWFGTAVSANGWAEERPPDLRRDFRGNRDEWDAARETW